LVVLNISGTKHFELIRNITNTTVYLSDPNLGNIEMSRNKFNELYIGVALIINGQAPANATILNDDE
jgi:predicted double-glycine peptidase